MSDILQKLRPDRDLQCYFLTPTAVAALSSSSETGFTLSGSWRQQFDWAVLEWNRDNTFEHPLFRNLPDGDLSGITLTYQETRQNCIPIDSNLFPTVDWPTLRIWTDATPADYPYKIPLFPLATPIVGSYSPATATFTLQGTVTAGDYVELAFSEEHYTYQMQAGDSINTATALIVEMINGSSPTMQAALNGAVITLTCTSATGANGNRVGVYANVSGAQTESWQPPYQELSGGVSPSKWQVTLDFANLRQNPTDTQPIPTNAVRKVRWTYSADLQAGNFARTEFQVVVSNWTVSGSNLTYEVAGPGSRRIEDVDATVRYAGVWNALAGTSVPQISTGNFSNGTIHLSTTQNDSFTCTYRGSQTHSLYLGTRKATSGAQISVVVDNGTPVTLSLTLVGEDVLVRLLIGTFSGQTAHTVTATNADGNAFYFDFLELAVPDERAAHTDAGRADDASDRLGHGAFAGAGTGENGMDDSSAGVRGTGQPLRGRALALRTPSARIHVCDGDGDLYGHAKSKHVGELHEHQHRKLWFDVGADGDRASDLVWRLVGEHCEGVRAADQQRIDGNLGERARERAHDYGANHRSGGR